MLKALELVGFKSFADKTRFEFPAGITVVVGPNGSGKSNIVDAMKWVLGEQSAKSLRGKDMADVIFKGSGTSSSGRKASNSAEVTIILDNSGQTFSYDANEIHLTRRVYRSGEGEYLINGQACRLKDIRDLCRGTGISTDGYSLIEQGKVDRMLQASPKDRRAIFEEAAGISRFKAKKIETQRRLARVEQNLLRLSDIVEEVENRYRSVKAQASKAARYREYTDRLQSLRTQIGLSDWWRISDRLNDLTEQRTQWEGQLDSLSTEIAEFKSEEQRCDDEFSSVDEHAQRLEHDAASNRELIATLESADEHQRTRCTELESQQRQLVKQLAEQRQRINELNIKIGSETREFEESELQFLDASQLLDSLTTSFDQLDQELADLKTRNETARKNHFGLMRSVAEVGKEVSGAESEYQNLGSRADKLKLQKEHLLLDAQAQESELADLEAQEVKLANEVEARDSDLSTQKQRLEEEKDHLARLEKELAPLSNEHVGATQRAEVLQELETRLEGLNTGVKDLLERSRKSTEGPLGDVCGLVADLIQVNVQHAPLIDVALGEAAQHLVIDGDRLVLMLSDDKLELTGRVGLIELEPPGGRPLPEGPDLNGTTGVVGRIADLVQVNAIYQPLVRRLLGNTWLVTGLADALRLRKAGMVQSRYVTLSCQLIETDGTILTGPRANVAGLVSRRSELRALKRRIVDLDQQIETLQQLVLERRESIDTEQSKFEQMFAEHTEYASLLSDQRVMSNSARQTFERTRSQLTGVATELESTQAELTECTTRLDRLRHDVTSKEADVTRSEEEIKSTATRISQIESEREAKADSFTSAKVRVAKCEQTLENMQKRLAQFMDQQKERQSGIDVIQNELNACRARWVETNRAILAGTSELAILHCEKQRLTRETRLLVKRRQAVLEQRALVADRLRKKQDQRQHFEKKSHEMELQCNQLELERETLASRLREDYGIELSKLETPSSDDEIHQREEIDQEIESLRRKINTIGAVNMEALNELDDLEARYNSLSGQYEDLVEAKESLDRIIHKINADSRRLFTETLNAIRENFQNLYRHSFGGGRADLVLEEGVDLLESGVEIIATPPGKPEFNNSLLSGGEKALTAVSLLMAIFQYRPSPFCVLDEVDAPFDEANIGRFIDVLGGFLASTKFVIVTHSKKTMTAATTLYGVTMQESGVSKRVSVKFDDVSEDGQISSEAIDRSGHGDDENERGVA